MRGRAIEVQSSESLRPRDPEREQQRQGDRDLGRGAVRDPKIEEQRERRAELLRASGHP